MTRLRIPAVSMKRQVRPPSSTSSSTGSTVVPATLSTTTRSEPASLLSSEDLPTLGLPTIAMRRGPPTVPKVSGGVSGSAARIASSMSPEPRPCRAETACGSPSPRFHSPSASASVRWSSTLLAASTTGLPDLRRILTTASSWSVMPTVASTTNSTASASVTAISAWPAIRSARPARVGVPAAGVHDGEGAAVPGGVVGHPVAGHAGHVLDDGLAAADDPVDQRRLADVGAADHREHGDRARRLGGGGGSRSCGGLRRAASRSLSPAGSGPGSSRPVMVLASARARSMWVRSDAMASSTVVLAPRPGLRGHLPRLAEDDVDRRCAAGGPGVAVLRRARGCRRGSPARPGRRSPARGTPRRAGSAPAHRRRGRPRGRCPTTPPSRSTRRQALMAPRVGSEPVDGDLARRCAGTGPSGRSNISRLVSACTGRGL